MTTLYLIRHAEAEGNLYRRAQGQYNSTITERGFKQIAALRKRFADVTIDACYSSDLWRTRTTALSIAAPRGLEVQLKSELREIRMGIWEDMTWAQIQHFDAPGLACFNTDAAKWRVEGGETMLELRERMRRGLTEIAEANEGKTVAVFSHGMALRMILGTLQGMELSDIDKTTHAENTAVSKLTYEDGVFHVEFRDDSSHLSDEIATIRHQRWVRHQKGFEGGVWYRPAENREGSFDVMLLDEVVGGVSLRVGEDNAAYIEELWLEEHMQGKGIGEHLVGQAASYARRKGCEWLRVAVPKTNEAGCACARKWSFTVREEDAEKIVFEKFFGYDLEYCKKKIQEVIDL